MKRIATLLTLSALLAAAAPAATLQVTTTEMNAATEGSLLQVMANLSDTEDNVIEFNFDGETLNYTTEECTGFAISGKTVKIDGINKKTGNAVAIVGATNLLNLSNAANVTLSNLTISGCNAIAIKMATKSTLTATNCTFRDNRDPKNESGNNGGVARINDSNATFDHCYFYNNKGAGSYGGGALCLYNASANTPALRVTNCTFEQNDAVSGGAIAVNCLKKGGVPTAYIANCTFANNSCSNRGGAIYMQTAETAGYFAPVIVNCTFVGNLNSITTSDDGGAINLWSRATTKMTPTLINNLFVENYYNAWEFEDPINGRLNDVKVFYLSGDVSGGTEQPQTVDAVCKNNLFAAPDDKFYTVQAAADNNGLVRFATDAIFRATQQNPLDEGDPDYSHQTAVLEGDARVAALDAASVAIGKGISSYESIEIPTVDQLGNARPSAPAVGAVEYFATLPAAIVGVATNANRTIEAVYTPAGMRRTSLQPGINIVRYSDGTSAKVVR